MMIPVHIIGLLYVFIYLKEVAPKPVTGTDNPALEVEGTTTFESTLQMDEPVEETKNACLEFFDPRHAKQCISCFFKKRDFGARNIVILLLLMHFITSGLNQGESPNLFAYQRLKLSWDIDVATYHAVFSIVMGLIGTLLMVGLLSKFFQVADIVLTLMSTAMTIIAKIIYSLAANTVQFFIGTAVDFCTGVKTLGIRAILSKIVPSEDLSTVFALMGLFEALAGIVFNWIYPTYYKFLLDDNRRSVSEMFHLSAAFALIAFIVFS